MTLSASQVYAPVARVKLDDPGVRSTLRIFSRSKKSCCAPKRQDPVAGNVVLTGLQEFDDSKPRSRPAGTLAAAGKTEHPEE
jgi:hypothetical protein